ncbi:MAG: hypothetical protein KGL39_49465 [Patescibacteria group bacterium]|nr:hypothetical protein [Patescibacteria group bacterium]
MNITYHEALKAGGPLAEAARRAMTEGRHIDNPVDVAREGAPRPRSRGGMNKWEQRLWNELLHVRQVSDLHFESVKLKLAGRTWYTPDFLAVVIGESRQVFLEVKGFMRDDAAVKLKTAASLYPEFRWLLVRACKGGWDVREVTDRGIGRERVAVAWMPGS